MVVAECAVAGPLHPPVIRILVETVGCVAGVVEEFFDLSGKKNDEEQKQINWRDRTKPGSWIRPSW